MPWSRFVLVAAFVVMPRIAAAQTTPSAADGELRALVQQYWEAWGTGDPAKAAPLYAKDAALTFYDLEPVKWVGWSAYAAGVVPHVIGKFEVITFRVGPDLQATRRGAVAWTTVTVRASGRLKAAGPVEVDVRHTAIWERRGDAWLIVHEHVSVPSSLPAAPAPRQ